MRMLERTALALLLSAVGLAGTAQAAQPIFPDRAVAILDGFAVSSAAGDFNGDGRPDYTVLEQNGPVQLRMWFGNASGSLDDAGTLGINPQGSSLRPVAFDLDGDGADDLVLLGAPAAGSFPLQILSHLQNGLPGNSLSVPSGAICPRADVVGDFSGDGLPDIAVLETCAGGATGQYQ